MELVDGDVITLECQNPIPGPAFLDGTTADGTVSLAPRTGGIYTGTHWQVSTVGDGLVTLACAGTTHGPRYLEGRPADSFVRLAPDTHPPFTGARWLTRSRDVDIVTFQCVDDRAEDGSTFLSGLTDPAIRRISLVPTDTGPGSSGTRWRVTVLARPTLTVRTTPAGTGTTVEFSGTGFTPNDLVRFTAEGVPGDESRPPHPLNRTGRTAEGVPGDESRLPHPLGRTGRTDEDGAFSGLRAEITLPERPPNTPGIVFRVIDRHGLTAVATTD